MGMAELSCDGAQSGSPSAQATGNAEHNRRLSGSGSVLRAAGRARANALAAKGHRNVGYRSGLVFTNAMLTSVLIAFDIAVPLQSPLIMLQLFSSLTLYVQWKTGRPSMFIYRGCSSLVQASIMFYGSACGRRWPNEDCSVSAWTNDITQPLRILSVIAALRQVANGISLFLHWKYPHRMFAGRGNEQLFWRGSIQLTGVPIHICRAVYKLTVLPGTKYELPHVEIVMNFLRAFGPLLFSSITLFNQWYCTSKGLTGNPVSDAWERDMDPASASVDEKVRVTIISASGLRKADLMSLSDPYCICKVEGRPESTWRTSVQKNNLSPIWNESCILYKYRKEDDITFSVYDSDALFCTRCQYINKSDDYLGTITLASADFHPHGYAGELPLKDAGAGIHATLKVAIEFVDDDVSPGCEAANVSKPAADAQALDMPHAVVNASRPLPLSIPLEESRPQSPAQPVDDGGLPASRGDGFLHVVSDTLHDAKLSTPWEAVQPSQSTSLPVHAGRPPTSERGMFFSIVGDPRLGAPPRGTAGTLSRPKSCDGVCFQGHCACSLWPRRA